MRTRTIAAAPCTAAFPRVAANDDAATHDLFSAVKALSRLHQLPAPTVFRIIDALERDARPLEEMPIGHLLALLSQACEGHA